MTRICQWRAPRCCITGAKLNSSRRKEAARPLELVVRACRYRLQKRGHPITDRSSEIGRPRLARKKLGEVCLAGEVCPGGGGMRHGWVRCGIGPSQWAARPGQRGRLTAPCFRDSEADGVVRGLCPGYLPMPRQRVLLTVALGKWESEEVARCSCLTISECRFPGSSCKPNTIVLTNFNICFAGL